MLVTDLKYGEFYKFSQWELNKSPGLHKGVYLHKGDHSVYIGLLSRPRKGVSPSMVPWMGHENSEVDVVNLTEKELYEVSPDLLQ